MVRKNINKPFIVQLSIIFVLIALTFVFSSPFGFLDLKIQDVFTKFTTDTGIFSKYFLPADKNIIILNIDDITQYELSKIQSNLNRNIWAKIINRIEANNPKVLLFDLAFENYEDNSLGVYSNDKIFSDTLAKYDNIILSTNLAQSLNDSVNTIEDISPDFELPSQDFNIINTNQEIDRKITYFKHSNVPYMFTKNAILGVSKTVVDKDKIVRQYHPFYRVVEKSNELYLPTSALAAAMMYTEQNDTLTLKDNKIISSKFIIPVDNSGKAYISWHGKYAVYETIPLSALLVAMNNDSKIIEYQDKKMPLAYFKDKIIVIGKSVGGLYSTPLAHNVNSVEITATAIDNLVNDLLLKNYTSRKPLRNLPQSYNYIFMISLILCALFILFKIRSFYISSVVFLLFFICYLLGAFTLFGYPSIRLLCPISQTLFCVSAIYLCINLNKLIAIQHRRSNLNTILSKSVSKATLRKIINNPNSVDLSSKKQEITIMECNIRNFFEYNEVYDSQIMIKKIGELFDVISSHVFKYNGRINNIYGNKMLVYWTKDDLAENAVKCAIEINQILSDKPVMLDEKNALDLFLTVNTDIALVGCVGKDNTNTFTIMGKCIDDLAYISKIATKLNSAILISENTYEKTKFKIQSNYKGEIKTSSKKMKIYEPIAILAD